MVIEAVQTAIKAAVSTPLACMWANVATSTQGATPGAGQDPLRKVIPQRANQEILIRGRDLLADLAKRTPVEIT